MNPRLHAAIDPRDYAGGNWYSIYDATNNEIAHGVCEEHRARRFAAAPEMLALLRQAAALGVGNADNYTWQDWFNSNSALLSRLDGQE